MPHHRPQRERAAFHKTIARLPLGLAAWLVVAGQALAFGFEDVAQLAKERAARSYVADSYQLPADLKDLTYDQYRDIRFKLSQSTWRAEGLPLESGPAAPTPSRPRGVVVGVTTTVSALHTFT